MTQANKALWGFILVAIGLLGVAYFGLAFTRTPAGSFIDVNIETGTPITYSNTQANWGGVGAFSLCMQDRGRLIYTNNTTGQRINGDWFYRVSSSEWNPDGTIYNLPAGQYDVGYEYYQDTYPETTGCLNMIHFEQLTGWDSFTITGTTEILYPVNGSTYDTEPNHFSVSWSLPSSYYSESYQYKFFMIHYGKTQNTLYFNDTRNFTTLATSGVIDYIPKTTNLNGEGYAKLTLSFCTGSAFQVCRFPIDSLVIHWNAPTQASVTAGQPTDFGIIGNAIRDVGQWLFIPASGSFNQFATLKDGIENKPPIGYFTLIKDAFNGIGSGSATASISLASITAINPIVSPIRTGMIWLLWFSFAIFLLKRFANFDFHI